MYCEYCGKIVQKKSKYCTYCGKKLGGLRGVESKKDRENDEGSKDILYGGFWVRLGAYVIDMLGVIALAFVVGYFLGYFF